MAIQKQLKIDQQAHWKPFIKDGVTYDLSHLDAHWVEFVQPAKGDRPEQVYKFIVSYSYHCFTKDYSHQTEIEKQQLNYKTQKDSRPFCIKRYELSKYLPDLIKNLSNEKLVFHGGYESYAFCEVLDENEEKIEYFISFIVYRECKKLRLHIKSAYPLNKPQGRVKKVGFFNIAYNLLKNKRLPRP